MDAVRGPLPPSGLLCDGVHHRGRRGGHGRLRRGLPQGNEVSALPGSIPDQSGSNLGNSNWFRGRPFVQRSHSSSSMLSRQCLQRGA